VVDRPTAIARLQQNIQDQQHTRAYFVERGLGAGITDVDATIAALERELHELQ
jgi:hypothetical protein